MAMFNNSFMLIMNGSAPSNAMQDRHVIMVANSVVHVVLFFILCFPAAILCGLCTMALLSAYEISIHMRVILINIFAAELSSLLFSSIAYLGYPSIALGIHDNDSLCTVLYSMLVTGGLARLGASTIYAIMVYVFIISRSSVLKWKVIVPSIVLSWALAILSSQVVHSDDIILLAGRGVCVLRSKSPLFVGFICFWMALGFLYLCVIFSFGLATQVYIHNNVLEENREIKRAIAKNLVYHVIAASMSFISTAIPTIFHFARSALRGRFIEQLVLLYCLRITFSIVSLITPIASMCILKPVRSAIKHLICCSAIRNCSLLRRDISRLEENPAAETAL